MCEIQISVAFSEILLQHRSSLVFPCCLRLVCDTTADSSCCVRELAFILCYFLLIVFYGILII